MEFLYGIFTKFHRSTRKAGLPLRRLGALGCLLSHVKVYNLMIDNNIPKACVLEDDAQFPPTLPEILVDLQKVPYDILMLSYSPTPYVRKTISSMFVGERVGKELKLSLSDLCRYFYRLVCYKIYFPDLNLYTVRRIISIIVKYLSLKVSIKSFNIEIKAQSGAYRKIIDEIGGIPLPDKSTWYRTVSNYCIARTHPNRSHRLISTTAYMLTKSAAIKWREQAVFGRKRKPIDLIINMLNLNLYIFIPPCVKDAKKGSTIKGDSNKINCTE